MTLMPANMLSGSYKKIRLFRLMHRKASRSLEQYGRSVEAAFHFVLQKEGDIVSYDAKTRALLLESWSDQ